MYKCEFKSWDLLISSLKRLGSILYTIVKPGNEKVIQSSLLEQINFNALLFTASLLSIISGVFNFMELSDPIPGIFTIFSSVIFICLYYLSRFKNYQNIWITTVVILLLLSFSWFMNGGATGSTSFIYIPAIILVIIIAKRKQQNLLFSIFLLNITILYFLEYYYGKKIIHKYDSPKNHYNDMAFVFYFVLILTFFLVRFFKRMFEDERNIVNRQKKIIEQQNKEHISSLVYASDLQKKIISNENQLKFLFEDYFVLFKPKDIVSGDFYWIKEKEEYGVIVVADCTGHGVPAALLSILGISLLEDVMEQLNGNWTASEFLEKLRVKFKFHLQKNNVSNEEKRDGIDLGVCVINYKESTFQFSGANRSLIMIRNNQTVKPTGLLEEETTNSHALYSYTATKNSVGFNYVELPFINHTIEYYPNDIFYVFSDGYSDQFDDSNKKKFKVKQLKKELLKIQDLPMYEQKEYLDELHKKWKGETEQTDDILIVGMKI